MGILDVFVLAASTLLLVALPIWIFSRIIYKAGYTRWWVLLMLVPLLNVVMIWIFAFADWPSLKEQTKRPPSHKLTPIAGVIVGFLICIVFASYLLIFKFGRSSVSMDTRQSIEKELLQDSTFPARPVWWEEGYLIGVGVVFNGDSHDSDAERVCGIMRRHGVVPSAVQVFDVIKIQNEDDWIEVGRADCR